MDLPLNKDSWKTSNEDAPAAEHPQVAIPPSPVDYVIRTMASDIATLAQNGGNFTSSNATAELANKPIKVSSSSLNPVIVLVGLLLLVLVFYFAFLY